MAAVSLLCGAAAFQAPQLRTRPQLVASQSNRGTPAMSLYEEYAAAREANEKGALATVASPSATVALAPMELKPVRRTAHAPMFDMDKLVKDSGDLLSHQAIMQNFVRIAMASTSSLAEVCCDDAFASRDAGSP